MATYNLLEHREVKRLLEKEESEKGFIEKYRVTVPAGAVHTAFAEMPGKEYDAYRIDLDGSSLFLVPNEMDDYYRYQTLPSSVFSKEPEFLGKDSPMADAKLKQEQEAARRKEEVRARNENSHVKFFENASLVNSIIPGFFDIPDNLADYIESIGSDFSNSQNLDTVAMSAVDVALRYKEACNGEPIALDLNGASNPHTKLYRLRNELKTRSFENQYGFSIKTEIIDGSMLSMKALNSKGKVMEEALVSIQDDVAYFEEGPEQVQVLDVFSEDNVFKRYGQHIECDNSLLAVFIDDFEDSYFEFSEKPCLDEFDNDGNEVFAISTLQPPEIYGRIFSDHKDVAEKLSLVSKVSVDKMVEHKTSSPGIALNQ